MTPQEFGQFLQDWGWPALLVFLFLVGLIVPRATLKREEDRSDAAAEVSRQQVDATKDLAGALRDHTRAVEALLAEIRASRPSERARR